MTVQPANAKNLQTIDRAMLTPLVRSALQRPTCEVIDWHYRPIYGGGGDRGMGLSGVYRFAGQGHDQGETLPWSLILKIIGSPAHGGDPQAGTREWLAYQSGRLNDLAGSFTAARCFAVLEQPDGVCWLWLEEVVDEIGAPWPLAHYAVVGRHLGQFNGRYLVENAMPDWPWLGRDWLRNYIAPNAAAIAQLTDVLDQPLVKRMFPADVAAGLLQLWAERDRLLAALDRLPQTLCHRDAFTRNLFARRDAFGRMQTVAIDWSFVGFGALGEEIVPLILASLAFFEVATDQAQALDEAVFNGYLDGLRDVGWRGDPQLVRFGYAAGSALRYKLGPTAAWLNLLLNFDEQKADAVHKIWGCSIETLADHIAALGRFNLALADEARALLAVVG